MAINDWLTKFKVFLCVQHIVKVGRRWETWGGSSSSSSRRREARGRIISRPGTQSTGRGRAGYVRPDCHYSPYHNKHRQVPNTITMILSIPSTCTPSLHNQRIPGKSYRSENRRKNFIFDCLITSFHRPTMCVSPGPNELLFRASKDNRKTPFKITKKERKRLLIYIHS